MSARILSGIDGAFHFSVCRSGCDLVLTDMTEQEPQLVPLPSARDPDKDEMRREREKRNREAYTAMIFRI